MSGPVQYGSYYGNGEMPSANVPPPRPSFSYDEAVSAIEFGVGHKVSSLNDMGGYINVRMYGGNVLDFSYNHIVNWLQMMHQSQSYRSYYADTAYAYGTPVRHQRPCESCGGASCGEKRDHHGWCDVKAERFWKKVNRLFWSRECNLKIVS